MSTAVAPKVDLVSELIKLHQSGTMPSMSWHSFFELYSVPHLERTEGHMKSLVRQAKIRLEITN